MKFVKPPKLELYSFLFSMPIIDLALQQIMFKERIWHDIRIWIFSFPLIFLIGICSWYMHVLYSMYIEKKFPDLNQTGKRLLRKALMFLLVMTPSILLIFFI